MHLFVKSVKMILLVSLVAVVMNVIRFVMTGYESYLWLNRNLFLALLPILFAWLAVRTKQPWLSFIFILAWFGFLPNAPYLVTDFIHIAVVGPKSMIWYDAMMIFMYSIAGIAAWMLSVHVLRTFLKWRLWTVWVIALFTGFGVYLGRYVRFNTWNLVTHPFSVFQKIGYIFTHHQLHEPVLLMTIVFAVVLGTLYTVCTSYSHEETKN